MQKAPLISIIIPAFNVEHNISRCINSILNQDYKNLEIIVIDDCSKDSSVDVCRKIAEKDSRVRVYPNKKNCGPATSRNRGMEIAAGEYIMFVDGDDFLRQGIIRDMYESCVDTGADLAICNYKCYYSAADDQGVYEPKKQNIITNKEAFSRLLKFYDRDGLYCAVWAKLYRRELLEGRRFTDGKYYGEDFEFIAPILNEAKRICDVTKVGYNYSQEGESLLRSPFSDKKLIILDEIQKWIRTCEEKYPELLDSAYACYYRVIIGICSLLRDERNEDVYKKLQGIIINDLDALMKNPKLRDDRKTKAKALAAMPRTEFIKLASDESFKIAL